MAELYSIIHGDSFTYSVVRENFEPFNDDWQGIWAIVPSIGSIPTASGALLQREDRVAMIFHLQPAVCQRIPVGEYVLVIQVTNEVLNYSKELVQEPFKLVLEGIPGSLPVIHSIGVPNNIWSYNELSDKPRINGVELTGNFTITIPNIDLSNKVDKVEGKGLSTEDYTTEEKAKLANLGASTEITCTAADSPVTLLPGVPYLMDTTNGHIQFNLDMTKGVGSKFIVKTVAQTPYSLYCLHDLYMNDFLSGVSTKVYSPVGIYASNFGGVELELLATVVENFGDVIVSKHTGFPSMCYNTYAVLPSKYYVPTGRNITNGVLNGNWRCDFLLGNIMKVVSGPCNTIVTIGNSRWMEVGKSCWLYIEQGAVARRHTIGPENPAGLENYIGGLVDRTLPNSGPNKIDAYEFISTKNYGFTLGRMVFDVKTEGL